MQGGGGGGIGIDAVVAQEDAFDIAVKDGFARAIGKDGDGGGGGASYAFQGLQFGAGGGEVAVVVVADVLRGVMEVARAAVVAKPAP